MTHTYQLTGMTCGSCEAKVKSSLLSMPDITSVEVSKEGNTATLTMRKHLAIPVLQDALGGNESKYKIATLQHQEMAEATQGWLATYRPILLIFAYVTLVSCMAGFSSENFDSLLAMRIFMSGFFLTFSFFKMLDLEGFAKSYSMYDVVAMRFRSWGYVYAFIEVLLGISYAINLNPFATNLITVIVMSISIIGVMQSVLNKRKIQCACLGAVFNLPMSTVTIVEDALMIVMAGISLMMV